ncbi:UDP-N-acetylmuramoyl-L-alanine--D-glutamate ligase [Patescibacteria group bacterium]|nr:UDP-N-acetylmuramoyl-L-alanine--D-glutamate ligase [Patescibacteria group bacterium]
MQLKELKGKRLLVLGFGKEGRDTFSFLRSAFPKAEIGISDEKEELAQLPADTELHLGKKYLEAIRQYDVVFKSPGIPTKVLESYLGEKHTLTSQTELFLSEYPGTIIGVTGTKGKSTTSALIHRVLKAGGKKTNLAGNIGEPVLSYLERANKEDLFVYELSSFQLELVETSPHIAVFLNLYPEHLDHHESFEKYAAAKENITRFQTTNDILLFNEKDFQVNEIASRSKAKKMGYDPGERRPQEKFIASPVPAVLVGELFGISSQVIEEAIQTFQPLPHRLERIGEWKGIEFVNDSLSTIPQSTMAAMEALRGTVGTLILGGTDRGIPFEPLSKAVLEHKIATLVLFPDTGRKIRELVEREATGQGRKPPCMVEANSMEEAVAACFAATPQGKVCLLSPASPSFRMFRDYRERGERFASLAATYGKNT